MNGVLFVMNHNEKKAARTKIFAEYQHVFRCPICFSYMNLHQKSLMCSNQHCFDLSKQGYVNLLSHSPKTKYDKRMFDSRRIISRSGFFEPLISQISDMMANVWASDKQINILDAGCGEGSHLTSIMDKVNHLTTNNLLGVGMDISKEGISVGSRENPKIIWCVADLAHSPFAAGSFNFVLNILSPSNYSEFKRMLSEDGWIIKVIPESGYLNELRQIFYDRTDRQAYSNRRTMKRFFEHFELIETRRIQYRVILDHALIGHFIYMTPLSWGAEEKQIQQVLEMDLAEITVDLTILFGKKHR